MYSWGILDSKNAQIVQKHIEYPKKGINFTSFYVVIWLMAPMKI